MIEVLKSDERGKAEHGWLSARHSFPFGGFRDAKFSHFRDLLVINEDRIAPGGGFPTHGHDNMEIVTYIVDGALEHKDSTGGHGVIRPGDAQRMSAGSGVRHSEFNASGSEPVHLLQIWIAPGERGIAPGYEQAALPAATGGARLDALATPPGEAGAVTIHADNRIHRALVPAGNVLNIPLAAGRHGWVQVVRGAGAVNGVAVAAGDGAAAGSEPELNLVATSDLEALVFDLR